MRFTASSQAWLGDSKSLGFLGVADREVLKKRRRKWRFSQTELVGYILPRAVGRFPPSSGRGGGKAGVGATTAIAVVGYQFKDKFPANH